MEEDRQLECQDCGQTFVFSAGEAEFYRQKSLASPPKRCKACRSARRNAQQPSKRQFATGNPNEYRSPMPCEPQPVLDPNDPRMAGVQLDPSEYRSPMQPAWYENRAQSDMAGTDSLEYRSPAFRDQENGDPPARHRRRRDRQGRMLNEAKCSKCGATAYVPFDPSTSRDVLCKGCYLASRGLLPNDEEPADDSGQPPV